jgi:hypothetical protein
LDIFLAASFPPLYLRPRRLSRRFIYDRGVFPAALINVPHKWLF